jgi:hypothetical protein
MLLSSSLTHLLFTLRRVAYPSSGIISLQYFTRRDFLVLTIEAITISSECLHRSTLADPMARSPVSTNGPRPPWPYLLIYVQPTAPRQLLLPLIVIPITSMMEEKISSFHLLTAWHTIWTQHPQFTGHINIVQVSRRTLAPPAPISFPQVGLKICKALDRSTAPLPQTGRKGSPLWETKSTKDNPTGEERVLKIHTHFHNWLNMHLQNAASLQSTT